MLMPIDARDIALYSAADRGPGLPPGRVLRDEGAGAAPGLREPRRMAARFAIDVEDVRRAAATIAGHVLRTPLVPAPRLSELTGATVFVKHENMHPTGAFKERGAVNKLASLGRRGAPARRHRHVGRQPRPGGRLPRQALRHPGDDRHAGADAAREGREHARPWRDRGPRGREPRRFGASGRMRIAGERGPRLRPPLRRCRWSWPARAPSPSKCSPTRRISTSSSCRSAAAG